MNPSFPRDHQTQYSFGAIDKVENKFRDILGGRKRVVTVVTKCLFCFAYPV